MLVSIVVKLFNKYINLLNICTFLLSIVGEK